MLRPFFSLLILALSSCSSIKSTPSAFSFSSPQLPPPKAAPNIFKKYSTSEDAVMATTWSRNFDMSGVSFNERQTATLITKRHVVMANHYKRPIGSTLIFHDRNGKKLTRILHKVKHIHGDAAVGLLSEDVPAGYKAYALPTPKEDYRDLVGRTAAITDQNRRIFFHKISNLSSNRISFTYQKPSLHGWGKRLVKGDSGNPSFIISGRELVLLETHTFGGGGTGPFYGNPELQAKLQTIISEWSPGYQFRTKNL